MFEAVQHRMWDITSGFGQWKLNSGWPGVSWQVFDWFLRPMVSYYYIKKANRPLHILWSPLDDQVYVVNHKGESFQGTVHADVYDFNMKKLFSVKQPVDISAESSSEAGLKIQRYDNVAEGVYFIKLRLTDADDAPVSDNFYWVPTNEKLTGLENLPAVWLKHSGFFRVEGDETVGTVTITNPTGRLAFFVRTKKKKGTEEVLPVFWSDNYISLLPGETQTLEVRISTKHLSGQKPVVRLEGWNLKNK
jgi:exo-1,4-beta-D-glucosaminidase